MRNKIVYAGGMGGMLCLLNKPKEEVVRRWNEARRAELKITVEQVGEIEFDDQFGAYDIWADPIVNAHEKEDKTMPQQEYKTRSVTVKAEQVTEGPREVKISTGFNVYAQVGDWIVTHGDGRVEVQKDDQFRRNYEAGFVPEVGEQVVGLPQVQRLED